MQKLILVALLGGASFGAHAQTALKAGTILLGGSVGYSRTSQEAPTYYNAPNGYLIYTKVTDTNSQFTVSPSIGIFVADNLAVGINGTYQVSHNNTNYSAFYTPSEYKTRLLQVGPFVQYYQMLTEHFGFTGTLGAGYQYSSNPYGYRNSTGSSAKGAYAGLTPGVVFFPIPKLSIGAAIGGIRYSYLVNNNDDGNGLDDYKSTSFGADFGLDQLTFSGTYYFGR